jgi:hypothetical protein
MIFVGRSKNIIAVFGAKNVGENRAILLSKPLVFKSGVR